MATIDRRDFLKLAGLAGVTFVTGIGCSATNMAGSADEFHFVQLSDTHWGFTGDAANPDAGGTLAKAGAAVNSLEEQPDFVVFTGDLTTLTIPKSGAPASSNSKISSVNLK